MAYMLKSTLFNFFKGGPMLENKFKQKLVKEIKELLPGCLVLHMDPNEIQGIPDLLILYQDKWAALEGKKSQHEHHQPNQNYYVDKMDDMSFARFIYPENKEEVLDDLQRALQTEGTARISGSK